MSGPSDTGEPSTIGWQAIDQSIQPLYAGQEPAHFGTILSMRIGGRDPLDRIQPKQGLYPLDARVVVVRVVQSQIRDREGKVIQTIGE